MFTCPACGSKVEQLNPVYNRDPKVWRVKFSDFLEVQKQRDAMEAELAVFTTRMARVEGGRHAKIKPGGIRKYGYNGEVVDNGG